MKGIKVLGFVFVLVLAGTCYQYFHQQSEDRKTSEKSSLVPFEKDQINELEFSSGSNQYQLIKKPEGWFVQKPYEDQVDADHMNDFLSTVIGEKYSQVVKEGIDIDWALYGLQDHFSTYVFKDQKGQVARLDISAVKNFEGNPYLRVNQKDQVVVGGLAWTNFSAKTAMDFRNKNLFRGDKMAVQSIEILKNNQVLTQLKSEDGRWKAVRHTDWKLDQNEVRQLMTSIIGLKASDILSEAPDVKKMKTVELKVSMKDQVWHLKVAQDDKKKTFAVVISPQASSAAVIDSGFYEKLSSSLDQDFRDRREPFQFDIDQVIKVQVQTPLKSFVVLKKDKLWELETKTDEALFSPAVLELIKNTKDLEVASFEAPVAEIKFTHQIEFFSKEGSVFSLKWSDQKNTNKKNPGIYLAKTSKFSTNIYLQAADVDQLAPAKILTPKK